MVDGGFVDFICYNWTEKYEDEPHSFVDSIKVSVSTNEFDKWLNTEAF